VRAALALVAAAACGRPAAPAAPAAAAPDRPTLTPAAALATEVRRVAVAECVFAPDEKPDGASPAHVAFLLGPGRADPAPCAFPDDAHPTVYVLPAADFERALPGTAGRIAELAALVAARPARPAKEPPYLPFVDASLAYVERVRYVDFVGGAGVLFLTELMIEPDTLVRRPFYVFQGLSADRRQVVLGVFPVATKVAVPPFAWTTRDIAEAAARHEPYRQQVAAALAAADESAFAPRADAIAATLASLRL
jgi:hypothetical protein